MKKIVFILFISFLISQICFGNSNITEQQDKLGVSIIGSRIQRGKVIDVITATMLTPNNLPLVCTDTYVYGTVPITHTLTSLDEVYIWDGVGMSWTASSWGVTSPHSFSATFNTITHTIPTGPTTLYASKYGVFDVVADFMVTGTVPTVCSLWPSSANRGTTANTWVYPMGMDATSTLITDTAPFGLMKDGDFVTATSWSTEDPGACYQVTTSLPETMATGDWLFYMMFNQDNFRYNINKTFGVTDPTVTWVGTYGSCWNYADNWSPAGVPNSNSNIVIPSGVPNNPGLNENGFCNNLEVNSGGYLSIPDYTLYVYNDLVNNGDIYQTGGTVKLYGTITNTGTYDADDGTFLYGSTTLTQTIAPSIDYHDLKATGENKVLSGNTSVYGSTYLDGAGIDIGNYDFTSYSQQFTQTIPTQDYIITSGTGALKYGSVSTPSVSSGLFPIGPDASNYNHFYFNNLGVLLDWLSARVQPGITPPHSNSSYCLQRTWDINYGPLGSLSANFEFGWNGSQETPLFTTARENDRIQAHVNHTGSIWETIGSPGSACGPGPGGGYTFQDGPFALVSNFALGDGDHTLPVELSSFNAVYSNDFVSIQWATASETDVIGFNLYRSCEDNIETSEKVNVSLIPGHGTTNQPNEYSFIDETADAYFTTYYYWLEAVNYGGTSNMYGSIQYDPVDVDGDGQLNTVVHSILNNSFPNPVKVGENITFNFMIGGLEGTMQTASLKLYNIKGELIKEIINEDMMVNDYTETWKVDDIANGVYFYQLKTENYTETKKLFIQ